MIDESRKNYLRDIHEATVRGLAFYDDSSRELRHKAEMILMSWAFIFAGIIGMFQADLLSSASLTQIIVLLVIMLISVVIAVREGIGIEKTKRPVYEEMWARYAENVKTKNGFEGKDVDIMEGITQQHLVSLEFSRKTSDRRSKWMQLSGYLIVGEIIALIVFSILTNTKVM